MKNNIDLTANSDFSNSSIRTGRLFRVGKRSYPWNFEDNNLIYISSNFELLFVGIVRDIKTQRNYEKEYEFHCDRCDKDLSLKPWDKQYCLCNDCAEQIDYEMNSYNYQTKYDKSVYEELINTTDDRVIIEMNWRGNL